MLLDTIADKIRYLGALVSSSRTPRLSGAAICAILVAYLLRRRKRVRYEQFPSPPADFFWGHLRRMPAAYQWKSFAEMGKTYGNIFQLSIVGRPMLIINTAEEARELLERRGANNSDRPKTIVHGEMMEYRRIISFLPYDEEFKLQRRLVHQYMNPQAVVVQQDHQTLQARIFLKNLLRNPEDFARLASRMSAADVVKMTYGYDIESDDDKLIRSAVEASARLTAAGTPAMTFVDLFPILRYAPIWFPGAGCMKDIDLARQAADVMLSYPYNKLKDERATGIPRPSLLNTLLDDYENSGVVDEDYEVTLKYVAGAMYGGGVQTTDAVTLTFILMIARNPSAMKRAQAEIDEVIGNERLPDLNDRSKLPFIDCVLKEVFRMNPPTPLGLPHLSMKDDTFQGKFIPGGTTIIANIWQMMRDERFFPDPESFNPERHLRRVTETREKATHGLTGFSPDDPSSLVFGFGRRICQGRFFADATAWLTIANVLAVFDILPPLDPETRKEMIPPAEFLSGFTSKPKPFKCRIVPRSEKHVALINQY